MGGNFVNKNMDKSCQNCVFYLMPNFYSILYPWIEKRNGRGGVPIDLPVIMWGATIKIRLINGLEMEIR